MPNFPQLLNKRDTTRIPIQRSFAYGLMALLLSFGFWAFVSEIDVVAVAEGKVIPSGKVKTIQPIDTGIVKNILVNDGSKVKKNDSLVELDSTIHMAERDRLYNNLLAIDTDIARLKALRLGLPAALQNFSPPNSLPPASREHHLTMLSAELNKHASLLSEMSNEIKRYEAQIDIFKGTIERIDKVLPLLEERVEARRSLSEKGFGPRISYLEIEERRIDLHQQKNELRLKIKEIDATILVTKDRRSIIDADFHRDITARLIEAERISISLSQELIKAEQQYVYQTLTAPIDGIVSQLAVFTIGGVVESGQQLMIIVPENDPLEIEASVLNKDIGFVNIGQPVDVKLESYLFTVYGVIPGEVIDVSRDSLLDENLGLIYPVRIKLLQSHLNHNGKVLPLSPGMHITADIKTEKRQLWEFLLAPILKLKNESVRER